MIDIEFDIDFIFNELNNLILTVNMKTYSNSVIRPPWFISAQVTVLQNQPKTAWVNLCYHSLIFSLCHRRCVIEKWGKML
jgi:hypothetical protein